MTERSIIALVSTPSGFAGRTDAIEVGSPFWNQVQQVNEALEQLLGVPTSVLRLISVENGTWIEMVAAMSRTSLVRHGTWCS